MIEQGAAPAPKRSERKRKRAAAPVTEWVKGLPDKDISKVREMLLLCLRLACNALYIVSDTVWA